MGNFGRSAIRQIVGGSHSRCSPNALRDVAKLTLFHNCFWSYRLKKWHLSVRFFDENFEAISGLSNEILTSPHGTAKVNLFDDYFWSYKLAIWHLSVRISKTGSDIRWFIDFVDRRYSFLLDFFMSKNPKSFVILYCNWKLSAQPLTFDKPRRKEYIPTNL